MRDPFTNYDSWLVQPYEDMVDSSGMLLDWAEDYGFDVDDPEEMRQAEIAFQDWLDAAAEEAAISAYEDAMDRKYDEMCEREWDYERDY